LDTSLDESWRPSVSGFVLVENTTEKLLVARVDPERPDAWRKEPYHSRFRSWARGLAPMGVHVVIYIGQHAIVVAPDRDIELGEVALDEMIQIKEVPAPRGTRCEALKVKLNKASPSTD
jgi:hypothetical protein